MIYNNYILDIPVLIKVQNMETVISTRNFTYGNRANNRCNSWFSCTSICWMVEVHSRVMPVSYWWSSQTQRKWWQAEGGRLKNVSCMKQGLPLWSHLNTDMKRN